jgi:hypothetical protein
MYVAIDAVDHESMRDLVLVITQKVYSSVGQIVKTAGTCRPNNRDRLEWG